MTRELQKEIRNLLAGYGPIQTTLSRFLDTNGDGTGTKQFNGDYSSAEEIAFIKPPPGEIYRISRLFVQIEDSQVNADDYGGISNGLTNGISVRIQDDSGTIEDLTDGLPIKRNADWARYCYDLEQTDFGPGSNFVRARWSFTDSGVPLRIRGSNNERFEVTFDDDLTGLISHTFFVQGYIGYPPN